MIVLQERKWLLLDDGPGTGQAHMRSDQLALDAINSGDTSVPRVRMFEWSKPTVTYGYLLTFSDVAKWARENGINDVVQRPTGGGAVLHSIHDVSVSLLWPRHCQCFSSKPRTCYEEIHRLLKTALEPLLSGLPDKPSLDLFARTGDVCQQDAVTDTEKANFSVCFSEPVCNDLMIAQQKVVGGALRISQKAVLYQGNIQIPNVSPAALKKVLIPTFENLTW